MAAEESRPAFFSVLKPFFLVSWPYYANDFYLIPLAGNGHDTLLWLLDIIFYTTIPTLTLLMLYRRGQLDHVRDALRNPGRPWLVIPGGVALGIATYIAFELNINVWFMHHNLCHLCKGYSFPPGEPWRALTIVYSAVSAGVMEEIVFRAHLMTLLKRLRNDKVFLIVVSSIFFSLSHWCGGTGKLGYTFVMGLIPAAIYLRTGNIWLLIIWHAVNDLLAALASIL